MPLQERKAGYWKEDKRIVNLVTIDGKKAILGFGKYASMTY